MYATMFRIDLHEICSVRERGQAGRSLATELGALRGFIAFIAFEAGEGHIAGLWISDDLTTLDDGRRVAAQWQREHVGDSASGIQPIAIGKVIVQRGL
jgi:hypothetical protein